MAEIFANSGGVEANFGIPAPNLLGDFIPGIDIPDFQDGFGLVTPLGGGATARRYGDYGVSSGDSWRDTQLQGLQFPPVEGSSFNFEGLIGPQGIPGRDGRDGVTTIIGLPAYNSNFLAALPYTVGLINSLGTAADKMVYTDSFTTFYDFVWSPISIDAAVNSWNEADLNTDGSFQIIAADEGIYISTDSGSSWTKYVPDSDDFINVSCAATGGKAILLGNTEREEGTLWVTSNYGVDWTEKTVSE